MSLRRVTASQARKWLPQRGADAHKGSVGRVYILAGSRGMMGASILTAQGAVKGGAGLVRLGVPKSQAALAAKRAPLEVTVDALPENSQGQIDGKKRVEICNRLQKFSPSVVAVGPGLGVSEDSRRLVQELWARWNRPLVIDADGLNVLAPLEKVKTIKKFSVITPHPGELALLLGISIQKVQQSRLASAQSAGRKIGGVCLLKGEGTVVTEGKQIWINTTGNSRMASGGMGDLLTGLIAALWGQMDPISGLEAAALGAFLHGAAGDLAAKKRGGLSVTASEVAEFIPAAINNLRRNS